MQSVGLRRLGLLLPAVVLGVLALIAPNAAAAATCNWNGGTGLWTSAGSWSCGAVPGSGDTVNITAASSVVTVTPTQSTGPLTLSSGNQLNVTNATLLEFADVANNGTISVSSNGRLQNQAATLAYSGTGVIQLDDTAGFAQILGGKQTFGSGQTVQGSGALGLNGLVLTNNGLITANVSTRTLDVDISGGSGGLGAGGVGTGNAAGLYNTGTMQADNGGALALESGYYENAAGGIMQAINGGTLVLNNDVRVVGGTLSSDAASLITATGGTQYLQDVTVADGSIFTYTADNLRVNGTLTNNGVLTLDGSAGTGHNNVTLVGDTGGDWTLDGSGEVVLDNSGHQALIYGGRLTLGADQTIRGSGQVGGNNMLLTNNGLVTADVATGGIDVDVSGGSGGVGSGLGSGSSALLNNNIMQADGGTLTLESGLYENGAGGVMQAINGGTLVLNNDVRILNGTLSSDATGLITATGGNQYLQNVTIADGSTFTYTADNLRVNGTLTNNGVVTLDGSAGTGHNNVALIGESSDWTLGGSGEVVLDNSAHAASIAGGHLTLGADQTIHGSGQVGVNNLLLTNHGLVSADVSGGGVDVDLSGGSGGIGGGSGLGTGSASALLNDGVMQADNGGTLSFESGLYENAAGGIMQAINGSTLSLNNDVRILNGVLSADATSLITATGGNQYLQNVTIADGSTFTYTADVVRVNGTLTNNGVITLDGSALPGRNNVVLFGETGGAWTLDGAGEVVLDNSGHQSAIYNGRLTLGADQTISGSGQIGNNSLLLTNNGLISANVSGGGIDLDPTSGAGGIGGGLGLGTGSASAFLNNNVMEADGGVLTLEGGLYENGAGGVMQAINGGTLVLGNDVRILNGALSTDATGLITATGGNQYLQNVTIADGSTFTYTADNLRVNGTLTNNGLITLDGSGLPGRNNVYIVGESNAWALDGSGEVILDNSGHQAAIYNGQLTLGADQTISGSGQIGLNSLIFVNNGVVSANVTGGGIDVDLTSGSGGIGGGLGVGTGSASALLNSGFMQAANASTLSFAGGRYENSSTGLLGADTGSTVVFNNDASLFNLGAGGVLSKGVYASTTTGAQSTLNIRSNASNSVVTIGTGSGATDTNVILSGASSVFEVTPFVGGTPNTIDATLTTIDVTGELELLDGRGFNVVAGGGAFTNKGLLHLDQSGTFDAASFSNSGTTFGNGVIAVDIANTGTVKATGGTLTTQAISGPSGTVLIDPTGTLALGGTSTAGFLTNNGILALGANDVTVTGDYQNANFGAGNAFDGHASVTGTGSIFATNATMDLSSPALSGGVLDLGAMRIGGAAPSVLLTITNNGTDTTLRGAVQNTGASDVDVSSADFVIGPNGGNTAATISLAGLTSGVLTGQSLKVVNNFDNVAFQTLDVSGKVYAPAEATLSSGTVDFGVVRAGTANVTGNVGVTNTASGALVDDLETTVDSVPGNVTTQSTPAPLGSGDSGNVVFLLDTTTPGLVGGSATLGFTSTDADLAPASLPSQDVSFEGTVTQLAEPAIQKESGAGVLTGGGVTFLLDLGDIQVGTGSVSTDLAVFNDILDTPYSEELGGSFADLANTGYSFSGAPFSGLQGGDKDIGNLLTFTYTGLSTGTYTDTLTFNGFSHFDGLTDQTLTPIKISITANLIPFIPEPATWIELIVGVGLTGLFLRRRRLTLASRLDA